nr:NACHT, LRR and PYD domains-containing protein 3-like isoform X2 [Misgurnus anguillicaudatus]
MDIKSSEESDTKTIKSLYHGQYPEPSCVSMKSDWSIENPPVFSKTISPDDVNDEQCEPKPESKFNRQKLLDTIFQELEHKMISLMKKELKRFKAILNPDSPACSEKEDDDYDEGQTQNRLGHKMLEITLHVLRKMNQTDLVKTLQTKLAPPYLKKHKYRLKKKFQIINEGISNQGSSTFLHEIYTELYITEGGSGEVNNEHEVRQIETSSRRPEIQETPIKCSDIFKSLPEQNKPIRSVLTKGVAGIGKTVSVQKFILDWTEGKANQDVDFIFPLPFRELNLIKDKNLSLMDLLHQFFTNTKELRSTDLNDYKVMFIFDGLDECRLPLDFPNNQSLFDVTKSASLDVLLTNLIKGNLLPSALIWITSRPAAANKIPPECIDQATDVRGFNDAQKDEYFRKKINDQRLANKIIMHIKSSRSLYIMCHIPVFCWISATVLERMLSEAETAEIPKTLTQMFAHFLIFQMKQKSQKYDGKCELDLKELRNTIQSLGKLAFEQLEKGNLIFYEEDLIECGIDVREASVYSGVCTQIFKEEFGLHLGKVFSFVHLSIQEFLAALYMLICFSQQTTKLIHKSTQTDLLKSEVDKALQSENGHLDLFLRFLMGLSVKTNQTILQGVLKTSSSSHSNQKIINYIKQKIWENPSPEKSINLFHCLNELNDQSLVQEVQMYLSKRADRLLSGVKLSPSHWSALVFVLLNSEEELNEFTLSKYDRSEEVLLRLLPVVKASTKANLSGCNLTEKSCSALTSVLSSNSSNLRDLNLGDNNLGDSGVKLLSIGLKDPLCKIEILQLQNCKLTEEGFAALVSGLRSNASHLRELNLGNNEIGDLEIKLLSNFLEDPHCKLKKLQLFNCSIGAEGCAALASALRSNTSHLRDLNMSCNKLEDSGVKVLFYLLVDPHCKLEKLLLSECSITDEGCAALVSGLRSNPSHLRELNLNYNNLGDSGVKLLSDVLKDPHCKLEKLLLYNCSIGAEGCADLASALRSNPSHLTELNLGCNKLEGPGLKLLSDLKTDLDCKLQTLNIM